MRVHAALFALVAAAVLTLACGAAAEPSSSPAAAPAVGAALHAVKARQPSPPPPPPPAAKPPATKPAATAVCPTGGFSCSTYFEEVTPLSPAEASAVAARAAEAPGQLSNGAAPWNTTEPCPTTAFTGKTADQIEAQLAACINAVRVNPARYRADFAALSSCSYSSWIAGATSPRRRALSYTDAAATKLDVAARKHATDMATRNFFSHTGSDSSSSMQRARSAGYTGSSLGENIAAGYSSIRRVMVAWMCSSGHRSNLLSCNWGSFGSGYAFRSSSTYKHYYVQNFGCGASSCYSCV